jgi:hypothetical protein
MESEMIDPEVDRVGTQRFRINGKLYRTDGPAVIYEDGFQMWFINDKSYCDNKSFQKAADISDEDMIAMVLKYGDVK